MNELDERPRKPRRTRADALRNREQIVHAAVDLIVEQGPNAPMETIARRANVGIATLYRHFPDRSVLLRQVALNTLRQSVEEAAAALAEEPDAFTALARFMHDAIDLRIGAVMPVLLADRVTMDEELLEARRLTKEAQEALTRAAHQEGSLRPDVTSGDISLLIIRLTPPLPGTLAPEDNHQLSHRHLELFLDGLLRFLSHEKLPGPALSFEELTKIRAGGPGYAGISAEIRAKEGGRCWRRDQ